MSIITQGASHSVEINKVLRNTYLLLSMTLLCSTVTAGISMALALPPMMGLVLSLVGLGVLFVTLKKADGATALFWIFAFTAIEGASLGPMLNRYAGLENGSALIMQALGLTSLIFIVLSAYVVTTKKDFSFMRGFLVAGLVVMIIAAVVNIFLGSSTLMAVTSAGIALLMTGFILYDTSRIVNGGETNYVRATIALYLDFLNLFVSLLHLLGLNSDD